MISHPQENITDLGESEHDVCLLWRGSHVLVDVQVGENTLLQQCLYGIVGPRPSQLDSSRQFYGHLNLMGRSTNIRGERGHTTKTRWFECTRGRETTQTHLSVCLINKLEETTLQNRSSRRPQQQRPPSGREQNIPLHSAHTHTYTHTHTHNTVHTHART